LKDGKSGTGRFARGGFRLAWVLFPALALDRATKLLAARFLDGAGRVPFLPGVLNLNYAENTGVAFSMMSGNALVVLILSLLLVAGVLVWLVFGRERSTLVRLGLWLIAAGGVGNLFDRVAYGYVVDFIEFAFVEFAIFNVADICVCLGAGLAILGEWLKDGKEKAHE